MESLDENYALAASSPFPCPLKITYVFILPQVATNARKFLCLGNRVPGAVAGKADTLVRIL